MHQARSCSPSVLPHPALPFLVITWRESLALDIEMIPGFRLALYIMRRPVGRAGRALSALSQMNQ